MVIEIRPSGSPQGNFAIGHVDPKDMRKFIVLAYERTEVEAKKRRKRIAKAYSVKAVVEIPPNDEEAINREARKELK